MTSNREGFSKHNNKKSQSEIEIFDLDFEKKDKKEKKETKETKDGREGREGRGSKENKDSMISGVSVKSINLLEIMHPEEIHFSFISLHKHTKKMIHNSEFIEDQN